MKLRIIYILLNATEIVVNSRKKGSSLKFSYREGILLFFNTLRDLIKNNKDIVLLQVTVLTLLCIYMVSQNAI